MVLFKNTPSLHLSIYIQKFSSHLEYSGILWDKTCHLTKAVNTKQSRSTGVPYVHSSVTGRLQLGDLLCFVWHTRCWAGCRTLGSWASPDQHCCTAGRSYVPPMCCLLQSAGRKTWNSMSVHVCLCIICVLCACKGQKKASEPLELKLQMCELSCGW